MSRVVFLDRDGVLMEDRGHLADAAQVELLPGVPAALRLLRARGWRLALVSNQSGVGRGWIAPAEHRAVHDRFVALLAEEGVVLDAVEYCLHAPDEGCVCRKPLPGLLLAAAGALAANMAESWMIGDKPSDLEAGRAAGCAHLARVGAARGLDVVVREQVEPNTD